MLKHKKTLILTSLVTLLPIAVGLLLWNQFPDRIANHWNFAGEADGYCSVSQAVLLMPLLMLIGHWFCYTVTCLDKGNRKRNQKPLALVLWIMPVISNIASLTMYGLALDWEFSPSALMMVSMGLMFAAIGNYLPKMKMNSTMGIKVPWAYTSEENWNATHRIGGKIWFAGGFVLALSGLLPLKPGIWIFILVMVGMIITPVVYSWRYCKIQKARGDVLLPFSKSSPSVTRISLVFLAVILVFVAVLLFTGDINVVFADTAFTIEASFYEDLTVDYAAVESIEYRAGNVSGVRVGGFGSFRLLMGYFQNEEFGPHTRYTYYSPESCIVLRAGTRTLVLSGRTAADTRAIYETLLTKINIQ